MDNWSERIGLLVLCVMVAVMFWYMGEGFTYNKVCKMAGFDGSTEVLDVGYCYSDDGQVLVPLVEVVNAR